MVVLESADSSLDELSIGTFPLDSVGSGPSPDVLDPPDIASLPSPAHPLASTNSATNRRFIIHPSFIDKPNTAIVLDRFARRKHPHLKPARVRTVRERRPPAA